MHDFEHIYLGESLEAYIDIAQSHLWEQVALASSPDDRKTSDLIILSGKQLTQFKALCEKNVLTSYLKGLSLFKEFPFLLHFKNETILLGREKEKNLKEINRFNFLSKLENKESQKVIENFFQTIFWNQEEDYESLLSQTYYFAKKSEVMPFFKENFQQNNGSYLIGGVDKVSLKKPYSVDFDSLWGKCLTKSLKVDSYSRLNPVHDFSVSRSYPSYNRVRIEMNLSKEIEFISRFYVDTFLKDSWIPFCFLSLRGKSLVFDLYTLGDPTVKNTQLEKLAKAKLAWINKSLDLPFVSAEITNVSFKTLFTRSVEKELSKRSGMELINIQ